jgi:hypothetical protein
MPSTELPRFACPDWWEKIKAGQTPMPAVPLNEARAAKALAFFNRLRLPDVAGNPPLVEACGEWFRDILVAFLASEDPVTKLRTVWELLCMVPKKNSKTTYVAALGLTALFMEETPNRQMLIVAPSQNISERCFGQAQLMIRLDSRLDAIFKVQDHLKSITRRKTGTKLDLGFPASQHRDRRRAKDRRLGRRAVLGASGRCRDHARLHPRQLRRRRRRARWRRPRRPLWPQRARPARSDTRTGCPGRMRGATSAFCSDARRSRRGCRTSRRPAS